MSRSAGTSLSPINPARLIDSTSLYFVMCASAFFISVIFYFPFGQWADIFSTFDFRIIDNGSASSFRRVLVLPWNEPIVWVAWMYVTNFVASSAAPLLIFGIGTWRGLNPISSRLSKRRVVSLENSNPKAATLIRNLLDEPYRGSLRLLKSDDKRLRFLIQRDGGGYNLSVSDQAITLYVDGGKIDELKAILSHEVEGHIENGDTWKLQLIDSWSRWLLSVTLIVLVVRTSFGVCWDLMLNHSDMVFSVIVAQLFGKSWIALTAMVVPLLNLLLFAPVRWQRELEGDLWATYVLGNSNALRRAIKRQSFILGLSRERRRV